MMKQVIVAHRKEQCALLVHENARHKSDVSSLATAVHAQRSPAIFHAETLKLFDSCNCRALSVVINLPPQPAYISAACLGHFTGSLCVARAPVSHCCYTLVLDASHYSFTLFFLSSLFFDDGLMPHIRKC